MKIYIASSFNLIPRVKLVAELVESKGHTITEKWWERVYDEGDGTPAKTTTLKKLYDSLSTEEFYARPNILLTYDKDFKGVMEADWFIFVADTKIKKFNGASVELGIALANKKPCILYGELEKSVLFCKLIRVNSLEEIQRYL